MSKVAGEVEISLGYLMPTLRERFAVKRIGLFGSTARRNEHPSSDIDLLAEFEEGGATFDHVMDLIFFLEDVFHRPIDLVTPGSISPYMKPMIEREVIWCEG